MKALSFYSEYKKKMSRLNSDEKAIKKNSDVEVVDKKTTRENENNNEKKKFALLDTVIQTLC
jgi:hypothetical protein